MKKLFWVAASALVLAAGPTLADPVAQAVPAAQIAQAPPPPASALLIAPPTVNWTGFYLDVSGGGTWGKSKHTDTFGTTSGQFSEGGGIIGGGGGYNWQFENGIVLGADVDMSYTSLSGSSPAPSCFAAASSVPDCYTQLNWLNTDRIRLGYAWNQFLPYITGGLAVGEIKAGQGNCVPAMAGGGSPCGTSTRVGWLVVASKA